MITRGSGTDQVSVTANRLKRSRRCLLAMIVSSLIALAALFMWIRSFDWFDRVDLAAGSKTVEVRSFPQRLSIAVTNGRGQSGTVSLRWPSRSASASLLLPHLGLSILLGAGWIGIPYWMFMLPAVALWTVRIRRLDRTRRWLLTGCCVACGYDLRGSPQGRCPECGLVAGDRFALKP